MKTAYVIAANGSEEIETIAPLDFLRRAGADARLIGLDTKEPVLSHGVTVVCDGVLDEVCGTLPDLLVLPGGLKGAANISASDTLREMAARQLKENRLLGAICATPAHALAKWGLTAGRSWTCYPGCEAAGESVHQERVVVDGNLITARGPGVSLEFAAALVRALCGTDAAEQLVSGTLTLIR